MRAYSPGCYGIFLVDYFTTNKLYRIVVLVASLVANRNFEIFMKQNIIGIFDINGMI